MKALVLIFGITAAVYGSLAMAQDCKSVVFKNGRYRLEEGRKPEPGLPNEIEIQQWNCLGFTATRIFPSIISFAADLSFENGQVTNVNPELVKFYRREPSTFVEIQRGKHAIRQIVHLDSRAPGESAKIATRDLDEVTVLTKLSEDTIALEFSLDDHLNPAESYRVHAVYRSSP